MPSKQTKVQKRKQASNKSKQASKQETSKQASKQAEVKSNPCKSIRSILYTFTYFWLLITLTTNIKAPDDEITRLKKLRAIVIVYSKKRKLIS